MSDNDKKVRHELVLNSAVAAAGALRQHHGDNAALEAFVRLERRRTGGEKLPLATESVMTEVEGRLANGMTFALLCYQRDALKLGTATAVLATPYQPLLMGVGEAAELAGIARQRIQEMCDQGRLPHMTEPYHKRKLVVRKAVELLKLNDGKPPTLNQVVLASAT